MEAFFILYWSVLVFYIYLSARKANKYDKEQTKIYSNTSRMTEMCKPGKTSENSKAPQGIIKQLPSSRPADEVVYA